ncbi:MAG: hypothetical protein ABIN58_06655 [candidate division WOR-3 bacterium]
MRVWTLEYWLPLLLRYPHWRIGELIETFAAYLSPEEQFEWAFQLSQWLGVRKSRKELKHLHRKHNKLPDYEAGRADFATQVEVLLEAAVIENPQSETYALTLEWSERAVVLPVEGIGHYLDWLGWDTPASREVYVRFQRTPLSSVVWDRTVSVRSYTLWCVRKVLRQAQMENLEQVYFDTLGVAGILSSAPAARLAAAAWTAYLDRHRLVDGKGNLGPDRVQKWRRKWGDEGLGEPQHESETEGEDDRGRTETMGGTVGADREGPAEEAGGPFPGLGDFGPATTGNSEERNGTIPGGAARSHP